MKQAVDRAIKTAKATLNGASSALAEDNGLGPNSGPQNKVGRGVGHVVALAEATSEVLVGLQAAGGGTAGAVLTAPASVTGVGAAAPAVSITAAIGGVVTAVHGALVGINTLSNITNNDGHPR